MNNIEQAINHCIKKVKKNILPKIKLKKELREILIRIFNHYRKKYNLTVRLIIDEYDNDCFYRRFDNTIYIGLEYLEDYNVVHWLLDYSITIRAVLVILHELKHVIDWEYLHNQVIQEHLDTNWKKYNDDIDYHDSRPFEQRAEEFAFAEVNKWGCYIKEEVLQ